MREPPVAAAVSPVREVTLSGTAEAALWRDLLMQENLKPLEKDDRAQILIIAAAARYKGIAFREVSFSVLVEPEGAYLVQAFNSVRFFAWVERAIFSTPYLHAAIAVEPEAAQVEGRFRAERRAPTTGIPRVESWSGRLHLPGGIRCFHARLEGRTRREPFKAGVDVLEITRTELPVTGLLLDSRFEPTEWILRTDALHVKSKTVAR